MAYDMKAYCERVIARAKTLTFGVEIECIGVHRETLVAEVLDRVNAALDVMNKPRWTASTGRDRYGRTMPAIRQADRRKWVFTRDGSLSRQDTGVEVVSPILTAKDIPNLQMMARAIKASGSTVDRSCGLHVHVGTSQFDANTYRVLVGYVNRFERLVMHAIGIYDSRLNYSAPLRPEQVSRFKLKADKSADPTSYALRADANRGRFVGLNLQSLRARPTVEFRWFNGTLHAGKIKSYVQLATHLAAGSLETKTAVFERRDNTPTPLTYKAMSKFLRGFAISPSDPDFQTAFGILTRRFTGAADEAANE